MNVSIEMARLIKDQCIGTYSGHMAAIPNNPVLYSICVAIAGDEYAAKNAFADILIKAGNALKETP